jgi:hypothetical protein
MIIYYVYAYLRKDGSPYYIGKGTGNRAWDSHRYKSPKNNYYKGIATPSQDRIVILESNLTSIGAFALERRMIAWYGRKDLGTGILHNKTDGGEGMDNVVRTDEWKSNISKSHKGKVKSTSHRGNLSKSLLGNVPWNKGIYEKREYRSDPTIYKFVHTSGIVEQCTRYQLREKYNIKNAANLNAVVLGNRTICEGWIIERCGDSAHHKS